MTCNALRTKVGPAEHLQVRSRDDQLRPVHQNERHELQTLRPHISRWPKNDVISVHDPKDHFAFIASKCTLVSPRDGMPIASR